MQIYRNDGTRIRMRPARPFAPVLLAVFFLFALGCDREALQEAPSRSSVEVYEQRSSPNPEGTGRFYMGREIAPVMGEKGADWLERPARKVEELPSRVVGALDLRPSDVVADIGAGTGYFTFRLSPQVPYGKVLAVDIQEEMLERIRERAEAQGVENVVPVKGTAKNPNLPQGEVDVVLMVDAYHEFAYPREMMEHIVEALKPGGRVVLVEYRGEDPTIPIKPLHKMTAAQARQEMEAVGLRWRETKDVLPQQHFMVFEKPM